MTRYYSSKLFPLFLILSAGVICAIVYSEDQWKGVSPILPYIVLVLLYAILMSMTRIVVTPQGRLKYMLFGLVTKTVEISQITHISKCATYNLLPNVYKSLCVRYLRDGKERKFKISANIFSSKTFSDLFRAIKSINPDVSIPAGAEIL